MNHVVAGARDLAKVQGLMTELKKTLEKMAIFSNPEYKSLEKAFISHYKAVLGEMTMKQSVEKALKFQDWDSRFKELEAWYIRKTKLINLVITGCVCTLKLAQGGLSEDDSEEITRILEMVKKLTIDPEISRELGELLPGNVDPFAQSFPKAGLGLPFGTKFALQESPSHGYKLLFGCVPCDVVFYGANSQPATLVPQFCNDLPPNGHIYIPKVLCMLKDDTNIALVFEHVPVAPWDFIKANRDSISQEHKKSMLLGLGGFLERIARDGLALMMGPGDLAITRTCQVTLRPSAFANVVRIAPGEKVQQTFASQMEAHPDTLMRANFGQVCVGWLIELLEFGKVPQKNVITGVMIKPSEADCRNHFSKSLLGVLQKLYVPNTEEISRPVPSVTGLIMASVHTIGSACIFSSSFYDHDQFEHYRRCFQDLKDTTNHGPKMGIVDRAPTSCTITRFANYVECLSKAKLESCVDVWQYELVGERDATTEGEELAIGEGPCRSLIRDFFDLALSHRIFTSFGGKLVFATENSFCGGCTAQKCQYFGNAKTIEALARATQLAMCMGVKWPKPFASVTVDSMFGPVKSVTQESCFQVFPLSKEILTGTEIYGPIQRVPSTQKGEPGRIIPFELCKVKEPFGMPNTIDMGKEFPCAGLSISPPVHLASLHLMDALEKILQKTADMAAAFRKGLGEVQRTRFWNVFSATPHQIATELICEGDDLVPPELLLKKIKFSSEFATGGRSAWFADIMCRQENNQLRRSFLQAVTSMPYIGPHIEDGMIKIDMASPGEEYGNDVVSEFGGIDIHACFTSVKFPHFDSSEQLELLLKSLVSSGVDYYNQR